MTITLSLLNANRLIIEMYEKIMIEINVIEQRHIHNNNQQ